MQTVHAKREVIVSAGTIGTPHLLQLSGIGDSKDLSAVGVKTIVNLPSVGKNLSDHVLLAMQYQVNSKDTFDQLLRTPDLLKQETDKWLQTKKGPLAANPVSQLGWFRLPKDASIFKKVADPTKGPASAHYEIVFTVSLGCVY